PALGRCGRMRPGRPPATPEPLREVGSARTPREGEGVVQQVLADRRELMIANERLRLELEELRGRSDRPDPRQHVLEVENRALREELRTVRAELDRLREGVERVLEEIEEASP